MKWSWKTTFVSHPIRDSATERRIKSFGKLAPGWHYGEGSAFSEQQIADAVALYRHLIGIGLSTTDAIPGLRGQIKLIAYHDPFKIEYVLENEGKASFSMWKEGSLLTRERHIARAHADNLVNRAASTIWTISDLPIRSFFISGERKDLTAWRLDWAIAAVPQLCNVSAWIPRTETGARLSESILGELREGQPFSYYSARRSSREALQ